MIKMAGTILKMRQMAILGLRCHQSRPISELKRPRILGVADLLGRKNRAMSTPSLAQQELDRELNVKLKRLQRASEILKNLSEEEQQRLNNLKMEYEVFKAKLFPVPSEMSDYDWVNTMELKTETARRKHYRFLLKRQYAQAKDKRMKMEKKEEILKKQIIKQTVESEPGDEIYRTFIFAHHKKMKQSKKNKGAQSLMFGRPFVIDLALRDQSRREASQLMKQLNECYSKNLNHPEPFHFHITGIPERGELALAFEDNYLLPEKIFIDFHKEDVGDIFPRERLVYLSSHSNVDLEFNNDDIYIMGGLVDLHDNKPYSLAKAKELGIRSAHLPLDKFFRLRNGCSGGPLFPLCTPLSVCCMSWSLARLKKNILTLDNIVQMMLQMNLTRDWNKAFEYLPPRFWDIKYGRSLPFKRDPVANRRPLPFKRDPLSDI